MCLIIKYFFLEKLIFSNYTQHAIINFDCNIPSCEMNYLNEIETYYRIQKCRPEIVFYLFTIGAT